MSHPMSWKSFQQAYLALPPLNIALDWSRMGVSESYFDEMEEPMAHAFRAMRTLETGAIANPDEERMVGHYWLRNPDTAPSPEITKQIKDCWARIGSFVTKIHSGEIGPRWGKSVGFTPQDSSDRDKTEAAGKPSGEAGACFSDLLIIGIGGSALGPQFLADALGGNGDRLRLHFCDNTDPDGFDRILRGLSGRLNETLILVVSKSGGTPETRNGMLEARRIWEDAGFSFAEHAVAITGEDSALDRLARDEGWLARFPMWDWVGGRTSVTGAVGLLPAALQGIDIDRFLSGAAQMDALTRDDRVRCNPAAILALMWHHATGGRGEKDMVILPYKDRLALFSRYLQQLVMESLGKELDMEGNRVHQGIAVYGNKGSTDQHAYVQQLREGIPNFFVTFLEVLRDRKGPSLTVDDGATSGDFLQAFLLGTQRALTEKERPSLTITIPDVSARSVGALIALYERTVGFYASLVNINAYHQPGVEAGKKAATAILQLKRRIVEHLNEHPEESWGAGALADALDAPDEAETIFKLLHRLAANEETGITRDSKVADPANARFRWCRPDPAQPQTTDSDA